MQTIDKKEALKRLSSLENEAKELRKINDTLVKITDRVKTFEDACEVLGIESDHDSFQEGTPDEIAYKKLKVIVAALNEGWKPNWDNSSETKWQPYFDMRGSELVYDRAFNWCTITAVGSRLCFHSRELGEYAGKQFQSIYNDYLK